ncbi:Interferon-induced GTP-binding protein Mx3 [Pleurostoma richardsiae]|uniref:Interferon-induced GTP-binding protein Mx3 n=1 Tax=Pleurostoma richardsiae TaxID=41990 RepID=A0AA38R8Z5_9PEZI|nr:Interferon-induced GTP-binding protein Mx3 [Pleurostoma richardsiae]
METSAGDVSLDGNTLAQLNSPDSKALLDTIDQLRQLQIGEIISLPQIVVVGDQSSGKSSVLEALSRVRFPVDGDVCTRFATELVLRRASEPRVDVSIQFSDRTAGKRDSPQQPFRRTEFDTEALPDIINEAKEHMGIRIRGERRFSKDVLRVEISGPDVYPLTLVDLPGYFHSETADQSQEDLELVNELVEGYMKQDKSIILAVVAANNQLANQIVTKQAKKHDPARERTLGVITKPDLAGSGNNRRRYLDLAQGLETTHELRLGWFVLRNQSEEERTASFEERDRNEKRFFESGPWSAIRRTNRGIESLRRKLSTVLLDHIKANLPGLIRDIEHNLETRRQQLQQLGEPRSTSRELRSYLFDIAERFHNLTDDALEGRYNDQFFGTMDDEDKKLRALIRNLNRAFDAVLRMKGGTHEIEEEDHDQRKSHGHNKAEASRDEDGMVDEYLQRFVNLYSSFPNPAPITQSALNKRLELPASRNQGREFPGVPNSNLAFQLFREEAKPWKDIAQFYIDLVLSYAQSFVEKLFEYIIGSDRTTIAAVLRSCVNPFFDQKKRVLREKLHEILRPYVNGYTLPLETEFHGRLSRRTLNRLADRLAGVLGDDDGLDTILVKSGSRPRRKQALETLLNAESFMNSHLGTDDVVDMMVTYYDMSLRTFTENVINLAVEGCLVCDLPSILTTRKVDKMPDDILRELALESEEVQIERQILQEEVKMLEEALTRCNRHRPIQMTVPPSIVCVSPRPEKKQNPSIGDTVQRNKSGSSIGDQVHFHRLYFRRRHCVPYHRAFQSLFGF